MAPIKEQAIDKYPYIQYKGRYEGMSESFSGSTNKRYSSKHGFVKYLSVDGASIKWNQLFPSNRATETANGITMTNSGGGKYTFTGTSTSNSAMLGTKVNTPIGHKFYFFGNSDGVKLSSQDLTDNDGNGKIWLNDSASATRWFVFYIANGTIVDTTFTPAVIDLTDIYGAGNEPTTLDDTRIAQIKTYALAHPIYDAGSLASIESVTVSGTTIETDLLSVGSTHDELIVNYDEWTVNRNIGVRSYQSDDESDPDVLTDGTTTYYVLDTPTQDEPESINPIEISSSFEVKTELDTTFEMVSGAV